MKTFLALLALVGLGATAALATETTTIYACCTNGSTFAPPCYDSTPTANWGHSSGANAAPGVPSGRSGCFYHTASTMTTGTGFKCQLMSDSTTGQRWIVYVSYPSSNYATDLLVALSSSDSVLQSYPSGTTIPNGTTTSAFAGAGASPNWGVVCYITPNSTHPTINFSYYSGGSGGSLRMYADCVKFVPDLGCLGTSAVQIGAPYVTNMTSFVVSNVTSGATAVTVYKQMGSGTPVVVGTLTSGIVAGNNTVALAGGATLEKNVTIYATQTVSGQEGCPNSPGYQVGIGNTKLQFSFNMRASTAYAGPIGAAGTANSYSYYFLPGASGNAAGNPTAGITIYPSNNWQSVTIGTNVTHGNVWSDQGYGSGDPWSSGRPAWGAIDSFAFNMSDTNSGPYEVYIDNFYNGSTLIHDWEDAIADGALTNTAPGLFSAFVNEGSTSPSLTGTTSPLAVCDVATLTNGLNSAYYVRGTNALSGTNSQYVKWQWNTINTSGSTWLRKLANASGVALWTSYPQVNLGLPIHFDILLAPLGAVPHSVGSVTWLMIKWRPWARRYAPQRRSASPSPPRGPATRPTMASTCRAPSPGNGTRIMLPSAARAARPPSAPPTRRLPSA